MAHKEFRRELPDSSNVVLFIHGIVGSPDQFIPFYDCVPSDWSIVSILLDGHGAGVRDFSRASMDKWKAQVQSVVNDLAGRYDRLFIVGHSMGTFFAMDAARRLPDKVAALCLLCVPLVISIKPRAGLNSMRVVLTSPPDKKPIVAAARASYGIEQDKRLWRYIGWVPRYLELFREAKRQRGLITGLKIPCVAIQSAKDELVSRRSAKLIAENPDIRLIELPVSGHFYFPDGDLLTVRNCISEMCSQYE